MNGSFAGSVVSQWLLWRDTVLPMPPHLDSQGLLHLVTELRITRTENGPTGAWIDLPPELDAQREEVLYRVLDACAPARSLIRTGNATCASHVIPSSA